MVSDPEPRRVVGTEFGEVVLTGVGGFEQTGDPDRCWRCDVPAPHTLDDIGLCPPCGRDLRAGADG